MTAEYMLQCDIIKCVGWFMEFALAVLVGLSACFACMMNHICKAYNGQHNSCAHAHQSAIRTPRTRSKNWSTGIPARRRQCWRSVDKQSFRSLIIYDCITIASHPKLTHRFGKTMFPMRCHRGRRDYMGLIKAGTRKRDQSSAWLINHT